MSAVFTGNGLGLFHTSLSQLGTALGGNAGVGQGSERQFVNVATGNLLLQGQDEFLTFRGLGVGLVRTYNSQGLATDVGNDGWVTGFERRVALHSGTFNTAGSVMRRHTGDGSYQDFVYVSANTYRSTAGDGAHDTLTWSSGTSTWLYVEGSTRSEDQYASHADATLQGRLIRIRDLKSSSTPVTWNVVYNAGNQIIEVRANDGSESVDALLFSYDGQGRLSSVSTRENGIVRGQVQYGYDAQGRLSSVTTDLTPDITTDNVWDTATLSNNNGKLFRTEYAYEGVTLRLATLRQSDGTLISYTYHADGRVKTVTRGDTNINDADGLGETTTYSYGAGSTTVTDSLGRAWVYAFDGNGQLTSVTEPAVDGLSDITTYQYDASGNVTQAKTMRGGNTLSLLDYQYDSMSNLLWQWDAQGNAISRTYSANNQVLTETRYTGVDPDRTGAALPTGGLTTHYVYDAQNRIRFVVNALGEVTGHNYATSGNGIGQLTELRQYTGAPYTGTMTDAAIAAWITDTGAPQKPQSTLSVFAYDAWGRLSQRTDYATVNASNGDGVLDAATAITRYTYDAQGLLRQQITLRATNRTVSGVVRAGSEVTDYVYDGMGRLLSVVSSSYGETATDANTVQTTYAYIDSAYQIAVTSDAGMTRTQVRNAAGRIVSVSDAGVVSGAPVTRTATNIYDSAGQLRISQDAGGGRSFFFYDAKGRLEATINATGEVARTFYDGMDRVVGTRVYANRVTTTGWSSLATVPASVAGISLVADDALDQVTGRTYDTAGRLLTTTDGLATNQNRSITTYTYDAAGRLLQARTTDAVGTASTARVVRYFHDAAGREIGVLDAAGYLTETQYDRAGQPVVQTRYATVSPSAHWAAGTLAQLRPAPNTVGDQTTRHYYDGRGQRTGTLDAQGYLTEWVYDEAGNARSERRYNTGLTWQTSDTLATLRSRAGAYRENRMAYNGLGQLVTQTNPEGSVTRYTYDEAGRLVKTEAAQGTSEVREGHKRYNVFGELIGELSGEAAPFVLPGMTESQLDAVYAQHGVRHGYDALGRRIESIDASGHRTWYFYDSVGRLTFTVRGVADGGGIANAQGEVTETRYNAFGQASEQLAYTGRITLGVPGSRASAASAISVLSYVAAVDTRRQFTYTARGQLAGVTDSEGALTQYSYDAFGQLTRQIAASGTAAASTTDFVYDKRGLLTARTDGVGTAEQRQSQQVHDAFGRVTSRVDGRGHASQFIYDRIGRLLTVSAAVRGQMEITTTSYDAHDRIVSVTDAESYTTQYIHNDTARTLQVVTPEGVTVTTTHNRHGQAVLVTDAAGKTEYSYNRDGQLTLVQRKTAGGTVVSQEQREYADARGLLTATVDGSGRRVELHYDAAGRVLQRIEDPAGLALTTAYAYDGQGRQLTVTDPSGRATGYQYDREGRLTQAAQDPAGLNVRTQFTYDAAGRQISVTEGAGTAASRTTQYTYDSLGRRTSEVMDPGAGKLNLTTTYVYDKNDNVIRRTDGNGQVTRFYYDEADRLTYTIDAQGGMTRHWYDKLGRLVASRSFIQATNPATLTDGDTITQVDGRLSWQSTDRGEYRVLDGDGRLRFVIDIGGSVTETLYDAAGRAIGTRAYATAYSPAGGLVDGLFGGTVIPSQILPVANETRDLRTHHVLDAAGQVRLTVDALGNVRELQYDQAGRLVGSIAYSQPATLTAGLRTQLAAGTATVAGILAVVTGDPARDQVEYRVHDAAGRLRYTIDAIGAVRVALTDASGQVVGSRAYATTVSINGALKTKLQAGTATVAEIDALLTAPITNDVRNQEQLQVRDAAGRVRFTIDVLRHTDGSLSGLISEFRYDAAGRVVEQLQRETPISSSTLNTHLVALRAGTANIGTVASWMSGNLRSTYWIHDAAGRVRYTLQANSASTLTVSERRYDALGQVVAEVGYAVTVPAGTAKTLTGVASAVTAAGGDAAGQQRLSRLAYDVNGQLRFRIDDAGGVTEFRYDALGRVTQSRQYALAIPVATPATESAAAAAVAGQTGTNVRITQTAYNAAGQVASVTDAAGHTESYAYDAIGQRVQLTNKLGHIWTYVYDASGRLVEENSPSVTIATATVAGSVTTATRSVKTVLAYDALGNVLSRTEDATGPTPRVTQYQYDSRGHQIRTTFPDAWQINPATGELVATGQAPSIEVTYDALGQAVVQKDVRGNFSYKVYDSLGRVAYDIDQAGYATSYTYNAFGEQSQLRRHATQVNFAGIGGFTAGSAIQLSQLTASVVVSNAGQDRIITTSYDQRGLKVEVYQSSVLYIKTDGTTATGTPITQFSYNAFGELWRTSELLDQAANLWAHSYQYYDELGHTTLSVDAEGYVTQIQYNVQGEATQVREFARALSPALLTALTTNTAPPPPATGDAVVGYDRVVQYTYDAMGRKSAESALRHYGHADGSQGVRQVTTSWAYDAAGQAIVTSVDGQQTKTAYDALGRVTSVEEAAQQRLVGTAEAQLLGNNGIGLGVQSLYASVSPYTALVYDAHGNVVRVTRYANGLASGQSAPVADATHDQVSVSMYDRQGRAVMSRDAEGNRVFLQYDAADNIIHSWYALSRGSGTDVMVNSYYTYDAAGRQLTSRTQRDGATAPDQIEAVRYNAFGEIVAKGDNDAPGVTLPAEFQYDQAGRMIASNAEGGAWREYGYNLAGHQVRMSHSVYVGPGNVTAVTRYTTDRLGRVVRMVLPSHTQNVAELNHMSQKVDRWGNVIELVDPRGYQTTYQYNDRDQLVKEIRPLVKVVTTNAAGDWLRPELTWSYDELGRLVASRDGNGNVTRYEYDGAGKQIKVIDANGDVTLTAYDALGRAKLTQNALGYVTFKQYDRLDRVTSHGDYLPAASGSTRQKKTLESYVLNQNGNRVQSTNALGKITKYDYDSRGLLLRSQTPMNVVMEYGYDLGGRRSLERYALSQTNVIDRDGETVKTNEQTWDYDYFGRLIDHNDLSGRDYDYVYDAASGQRKSETNSTGLNRVTLYYANGLVREIQEPGGTVYRYAYDQAGNRISEEAYVKDSRGKQYNVRTQIIYDSHNRLQRVVQDDLGSGQRVFELTYDYDAAGNRTHVVARTGYGENTAPIEVLDNAPVVLGSPANRTIRTGVASEFRVRLTDIFRDPEGKPLSVTAVQVASGAETALPSWLSYTVDAATGEMVFTSTTGSNVANNQSFTLRLKASDGSSTSVIGFTLSVRANTAPSDKVGVTTSFPVKTGRAWLLELPADAYFTDPDVGDSLSISAAVSPAAPWLTIDNSNPSVTRLSAIAPVAGTYTVTLTATDQLGATKTRAVTLVVAANAAPSVVAPIPAQQATLGRSFELGRDLSAVFADAQGDALSVIATLANGAALPSWLNFSFLSNQAVPQLRLSGEVPGDIADGTIYQIKLTATDPDGASVSTTFNLTIRANQAPTVVSSPPAQQLRIGQALNLQISVASLFLDPDGDAMNFELLHPQGATKTGWVKLQVDHGTGMLTLSGTPNIPANHVGTYSVQIRARDTEGLTATVAASIEVKGDNAPVRTTAQVPDRTLSIGRAFSFTLPSDMFTDADGDPITLMAGVATEHSEWLDTIPPSWIYWVNTTPLPSWMSFNPATRTFSGTVPPGTSAHGFVIRVGAHDGRLSSAESDQIGGAGNPWDSDIVINVAPFVNSAPIYNAGTIPNRTVVHGGAVDFSLPAGAFTEPDGDALTYSAQVQVGGSWVNISQLGLSINASTGRITGTATNLTQATFNARIVASDPQGAQGIGTFVLNVTNTPPTATSIPTQNVQRNVAWNFSLLPFFSDVNQNVLTFTATGLPTGLSLSSAGQITGSPSAALGSYTVNATANDGRGGTVSQSFTLTLVNAAPTAPTIPNQTATAGSGWSYTVPAFSDPNGDTLTYSVTGLPAWMSFNASTRVLSGTPGPVGTWTVTITAQDPSGATASRSFTVTTPNVAPVVSSAIPTQNAQRNIAWSYQIPVNTFTDVNGDVLTYSVGTLPSGITFNAGTRTFSGTLTALGSHTVTVTANDGRGGSINTSFTLAVVNGAPTAPTIPNQTATAGSAWTYTVPAFSDPNGDALTYTVSGLPAWMSFNASTRVLSGTPGPVGGWTITVTARDPSNATVSKSFTVTTPNVAPVVANAIPNQNAGRNQAWSYQFPANTFSDINGDTLTYSVSGLPTGISFNAGTRTFSGTPTAALGNYTVTVTANDGRGGTINTSFTLAVVNSAPTAPTIPNQTATAGSGWSYTVPAFSDPNGDTLTYSVTGLPAWMSFNASTRVLSGTPGPVGTWTVTVTAQDPSGATASRSFTVTTPNVAPVVANAIGTKTVARNTAWTFQVPANTFSDANGDALTYSVGALPAGISFNAGTRTFTGSPTALGNHTITVSVNDGNGGTRSTSFTLSVTNNPPVYSGGLVNRVANHGTAINWTLPGGVFSDPNGDALSYSMMVERPGYWSNEPENSGPPYPEFPIILPEPRWVEPEWHPASWYGLSINSSTGTITGTANPIDLPGGGLIGAWDYRVMIIGSDGSASVQGIFNLTVNAVPDGNVPNQVINSSTPWSYQIPAFFDLNGHALSYSVSGLPAGLAFNAGNRTISGSVSTPGSHAITVTVNDGYGGVVNKTFTLTVLGNNAPTAPSIPNQSATLGTVFGYTVPAFTDPNGDVLSYSASGLPPGLSFNAGSRAISGTPTATGSYTVTVTANDGRGGTVSASFTLTVASVPVNQPPVLQIPIPHALGVAGLGFTHQFAVNTFVDPNGDPLSYTATGMPWGISFNSGLRRFSGTPSYVGSYEVTVTAHDGKGGTASTTFWISVESGGGGGGPGGPGGPEFPEIPQSEPVQIFMLGGQGEEGVLGEVEVPMEGGYQPMSGGGTVVIQESWYAYDKLNRVSVVNGVLENGQVAVAKNYQSYGLTYDAAGNQVSQHSWRSNGSSWWTTVKQQTYSLRGELLLSFNERPTSQGGSGIVERRVYDDAGREIQRMSYFGPGSTIAWVDGEGLVMQEPVAGWLHSATVTTYDDDGRMLTQQHRSRSDEMMSRPVYGGQHGSQLEFPVWIHNIWLNPDDQHNDLNVLTQINTVSYAAGGSTGYDAAGRVKGYTYTGQGYTHTYTYTYEGWDSYREKVITGSSTNNNYKTTTSTMTYNSAGHQTEIREKTNGVSIDDRIRSFAHDGSGMILGRRDGTATSANVFQQKNAQGQTATGSALGRMNLRNVYANGQQVAGLDEAGKLDVLSRMTAFSNSESGRTQTVVQAGETLRNIAQRVYGNANLWYVLAAANALEGDGDLVAGTTLTVPEVKTSSNDANTFKPYNPGEITGPTSPGLPYIEPPDKGCGTLGMIIMVVVAVVVTVYTAGAVSGAFISAAQGAVGGATAMATTTAIGASAVTTLTTAGAITVGAIAGAVGAAASMAVGSAMGVASFNWRGVAAGAITGAITGGIASRFGTVAEALKGAGGAAPNIGKAATLALVNAGANYTGQKLTGVDVSFSWRSIAASAVSSMVSAKVTPGLVGKMNIKTDFGYDFASGMAGGMVSAGVRSMFGQTLHKSDYMTVVADAFGNALGNAIARGSQRGANSKEAKEHADWNLTSSEQEQLHSLSDAQQQVFFDAAANGKSTQEALVAARNSATSSSDAMAAVGSGVESGKIVSTWDEIADASHRSHAVLFPDAYGSAVSTFNSAWSYEEKNEWYAQHRLVHDLLPVHDDNVLSPTSTGGSQVEAITNASIFGITPEQVEADIAAGKTGAMDAAWYAARATGYEVWNFASLGFLKRHDARLTDYANGRLSQRNFWTATALDGVGSVASLYGSGRVLNYATARLGTGYAGYMGSGAVTGMSFDAIQQGTGMVTYAMTGGQVGQSSYSWQQTVLAGVGGAALGGVMRYASTSQVLNTPLRLQNPVILERAPVFSMNGFGAVKGLRSPIALQAQNRSNGLALQAELRAGMNAKEFNRKINRLQHAIDNGKLNSNIPHAVSSAERRALTRQYRNDLAYRIEKFYANNPQARESALTRLRNSDIDHIRDLQLGGQNVRSNLKTLDSLVNQDLGRQISRQLPRGVQQPILRIDVEYYP